MKKIRCGIIGVGMFGEQHLMALKSFPTVEVTAICRRNEDKLKVLAGKYDIDLSKYTWAKHAEADFEDLEKMPKKEKEEFLKKLEKAVAEYDEWKQTSR